MDLEVPLGVAREEAPVSLGVDLGRRGAETAHPDRPPVGDGGEQGSWGPGPAAAHARSVRRPVGDLRWVLQSRWPTFGAKALRSEERRVGKAGRARAGR